MLRIRIRIHVFWGLLDPDPLVRGMDPAPDLFFLSSSKKGKKNLDFYCFVTSFWLFTVEKWCKVPSKSIMQKNFFFKLVFLASWRSMMKIEGSGSISQRHGSADPDPHQNVMDPQHWLLQFVILLLLFSSSTSNPPPRPFIISESTMLLEGASFIVFHLVLPPFILIITLTLGR